MAIYQLADLTVELKNKYPYTDMRCKDYLSFCYTETDICVETNALEIENELLRTPNLPVEYIEYVCLYRNLAFQLPQFHAMVMHGCIFEVEERGVALLAPSGVGKTTHMRFWNELCPSLQIVNGDKPIIRFWDGVPYAYGTPWAGKENYQCNIKVKLTDICFLERSSENMVFPADKKECVALLMKQLLMPYDFSGIEKTLEMADALLKRCHLWKIKCTPTLDAAEKSIEAILR